MPRSRRKNMLRLDDRIATPLICDIMVGICFVAMIFAGMAAWLWMAWQ